jgi:hypothetical protein
MTYDDELNKILVLNEGFLFDDPFSLNKTIKLRSISKICLKY